MADSANDELSKEIQALVNNIYYGSLTQGFGPISEYKQDEGEFDDWIQEVYENSKDYGWSQWPEEAYAYTEDEEVLNKVNVADTWVGTPSSAQLRTQHQENLINTLYELIGQSTEGSPYEFPLTTDIVGSDFIGGDMYLEDLIRMEIQRQPDYKRAWKRYEDYWKNW